MNLVDLLRRYAGQSPQSTGGTHTPLQTSTLLLLTPAQAAQSSEAELPPNNKAQHGQMPKVLSTATTYGAPKEPGAEKSAILTHPLKRSLGLPRVTSNWQDQLAGWPQEWRDLWDERAAIMEVEGGLSRDRAEREAFERLRDNSSHPEYGVMASDLFGM